VKEDIRNGKTKILYVAPESLNKDENVEFLRNHKISFYAIAQLNIFQAPINSFCQESIGINGEKDGIILTAPKLITDSQEIQFRLHVPQGLTISGTTNRYFIEVALRGAEIRVKS
ncbi:MAG: hypothetical protein IIW86_00985, partial [Clostridia bacterium]|nr:hypothetical protein [Clostridia bacterium]